MTITTVTDADFKKTIAANGVTLVDFGAPWCAPCKALMPVLEELAEQFGEVLSIVKVNVEEAPAAAGLYGVMSMPTVVVFRDGEAMEKLVGLRSKEAYAHTIAKYAAR